MVKFAVSGAAKATRCTNQDEIQQKRANHRYSPACQSVKGRQHGSLQNSKFGMCRYPAGFALVTISSYSRRRLEGDLILCYNLFHGICEIYLPFKLGVSVTRGNSFKLVKSSCNTNAAKYFIQMLRNILYK